MKDKTLFPPPPAIGNLTSKQTIVLELLQHNPNGLRATDIGRHLHHESSYQCACSDIGICKYAMPNATAVLDSLGTNKRELVIRRKTGLWQLLPAARPRDSGSFPDDF